MSTMKGRCLCRTVSITVLGPTMFASYCHCESCRLAHAAPFVAWTAVSIERFRVTAGEAAIVRYVSSPGVERAFCGRCGTSLFYAGAMAPDRVYVPIAILDHLDRALDSHVSYEEHAPWIEGLCSLPCHAGKSEEDAESFR